MDKIIAIVGRPNVGKSTLFNRILGKRHAIVHSESGVTRDRNYGEADWTGKKFFLIDTGGYVPDSEEVFDKAIRAQVKMAVDEATKILFVVDVLIGIHPIDQEFARVLRKFAGSKPIFLVVNKIDNPEREINAADFYKLGLGEPIPVSALSGRNVAELLDEITGDFSMKDDEEDTRPKFAIVGRPNAGKSSIANAIMNEERNIVTDIPGTTRDSIDSVVKFFGEEIVLIDTAGLKRKSKIKKNESLEFYSTVRTYKAILKSDVVILVIDAKIIFDSMASSSSLKLATFKLDRQDIKIIDDVTNYKKGLLIVINKWDLVEKDSSTAKIIENKIASHLRSYNFLKFIFISAITKQRIHKVLEEAKRVYDERLRKIKTSELNDKILEEIKKIPHPSAKGKEVKINYITQVKSAPPVFTFFVNDEKLISENYRKFLDKKIREHFGFSGVPITLLFRKKNPKK
jgi:GTPase